VVIDGVPYKVVWLEPIPLLIHDFGSIAAGKAKDKVKVETLKMPKSELGHFRFKVLDDVEVELYQPKATARFATVTEVGKVDFRAFGEVFVWEDAVPYMTVRNPTRYDLPMSRVAFSGYRLQLERLPEVPPVYAFAPISGKPPVAPA